MHVRAGGSWRADHHTTEQLPSHQTRRNTCTGPTARRCATSRHHKPQYTSAAAPTVDLWPAQDAQQVKATSACRATHPCRSRPSAQSPGPHPCTHHPRVPLQPRGCCPSALGALHAHSTAHIWDLCELSCVHTQHTCGAMCQCSFMALILARGTRLVGAMMGI